MQAEKQPRPQKSFDHQGTIKISFFQMNYNQTICEVEIIVSMNFLLAKLFYSKGLPNN